jgi:hypothetical protein
MVFLLILILFTDSASTTCVTHLRIKLENDHEELAV